MPHPVSPQMERGRGGDVFLEENSPRSNLTAIFKRLTRCCDLHDLSVPC